MSGRHVGTVFRCSRHAGAELLVLACIAETLNDRSDTWSLSVETIANRCKLSRRTVFRALGALRASGELVVRSNAGPGGINFFALGLAPPVDNSTEGVTPMAPPRAIHDTSPAPPMAPVPEVNQISPESGTLVNKKPNLRDFCKALVKAGVSADVSRPGKLPELIALGGTVEDVVAEVARHGDADDPLSYALGVLVNRARKAGPGPVTEAWDASFAGIERAAASVGIGKWDKAAFELGRGENSITYTNRVRAALSRRAA
jgi:hypothetical protein